MAYGDVHQLSSSSTPIPVGEDRTLSVTVDVSGFELPAELSTVMVDFGTVVSVSRNADAIDAPEGIVSGSAPVAQDDVLSVVVHNETSVPIDAVATFALVERGGAAPPM
jgi:predicted ribosome-associated RNA-binding protein Tma20